MIPLPFSARGRSLPDGIRWGVALAAATALISGISVFVNGSAVRLLPDAAVFTTLKNGVAAVVLLALAGATVRRPDVRVLDRRAWATVAAIGVVGGSVPFLLFFTGLAQASAPIAAFIHKTLFVWVAILAVPILGERLGLAQLAALGVLVIGQILIAPPAGVAWGIGETLIAAATLLWAVETIVARRLLARVSMPVPPQVLGAGRLGFGLAVLIGYVVVSGRAPIVGGLTVTQWVVVLGTGLLLSGYVATWFAALRRAPASLVTAVLVLGAPVTALLQAVSGATIPPTTAIAGQGLIVAGALALAVAAVQAVPAGAGTPRRAVPATG